MIEPGIGGTTVAERVLSRRELNRATLARQLLLERATLPAATALERLVGLQAQQPRSPFVGLWSRLADFERDALRQLIAERGVVKATAMRATLHLLTADDYLRWRATLQPVLTSAQQAIARQRGAAPDVPALVAAARRYLSEAPRTFAEISKRLTELQPDGDPGAMRYAVRTHLPLVQVPIERDWSYPGNPRFTLADDWLGRPIPTDDRLPELIHRYLTAFGPASVADLQTWSGLGKLKPAVEALRPDLALYRDERRRELFDLPDQPLPEADQPAPVRFLPEYDNLLLSHQDRTRVVAQADRGKVYLPGLRVAATFLIDGFVAGTWTVERTRQTATLTLTPFEPLAPPDRAALEAEGAQLLRFVEPEAQTFDLRFAN
jgi:winged helix DNA-binding protein